VESSGHFEDYGGIGNCADGYPAEKEGRPMVRVCVDARLKSGMSGGVESVVIGMASGLSQLDGDEEYLFLAYHDSVAWLRPYLSGRCSLLTLPAVSEEQRKLRGAQAAAGPRRSDGAIERAGVDVMHFTLQWGFLTDVPSLYHPHDLQHLHLPEFFTPDEIQRRQRLYRPLCAQARTIVVASEWTRRDVIWQYRLPAEKVRVISFPPVLHAYAEPTETELTEVRRNLSLPERFVLYPAQTWPHKNHLKLLEAIALLRDAGVIIPLICCGRTTEYFPTIARRIGELDLAAQVRFVGFVTPLQLRCLYRMCTATVVPTRFEAASGPVMEAMQAGAPVACSNVTSLPEQAGDAALLFSPDDTAEMAAAIRRLWQDQPLCDALTQRGKRNVGRLSWQQTARQFRALYRQAAGRTLDEEDQSLLARGGLY
jgi:glycosyltransferase involved in cell wall biosynthesis